MAAPSCWFGRGGDASPGLGWRQARTSGLARAAGSSSGSPGIPRSRGPQGSHTITEVLKAIQGVNREKWKSLENQHSPVPAMQLSSSVPVSLRCQQASEQQCWAAESARNLPSSFTGPTSEGPTCPVSTEHLRSLGRGQCSAAEGAGAQGGDQEQS